MTTANAGTVSSPGFNRPDPASRAGSLLLSPCQLASKFGLYGAIDGLFGMY